MGNTITKWITSAAWRNSGRRKFWDGCTTIKREMFLERRRSLLRLLLLGIGDLAGSISLTSLKIRPIIAFLDGCKKTESLLRLFKELIPPFIAPVFKKLSVELVKTRKPVRKHATFQKTVNS